MIFEANCCSRALQVLKHPNSLRELCVTVAAAVPTADCVDKRAKLAGKPR